MWSAEQFFERYGPAYRWLATLTAMVAAIAVVLSSTIVNVAVPAIMGQFGIDQTQAQWLSTGFLAAMTVTMLMTAWGERRFGQRGTMVAALSLFLFGSVLGGVAPDQNVLIVSRVLQGLGAGLVQPLAMVVMFQVFPPHQRGTAMGLFGIGVVLAPALGPWVGGVLMDSFDWRFLFYLGIPFGAAGIGLAGLFLPSRDPHGAKPALDWPALVWLAVALLALLQGLSSGQRLGWSSNTVLGELALAVIAAAGFLWHEIRTADPLLDLRVFRNLPFAAATMVSFVLGAGLFGSTFLLPLFVQQIQNFTPTNAGLLLMPAGFVLVLVFPLAGYLSDRISPGLLIGFGLLVFAYSSWLMGHVSVDTSFWTLAWWTVIGRIGMGAIFPSLSAASLKVLPPELLAQGSGTMNFIRQLGGAIGTALLVVFLERRTIFHGDVLAATQTPDNVATMAYLQGAGGALQGFGLGPLDQQGAAGWLLGRTVYYQAAAAAYRDSFLVTAAIFAAALLPTWLLHRAQRTALKRSAAAATAMESEADIEAGFALEPFGSQRGPA
jgi:EmrB/QacA subfamily drug resistance transporter